MPKKSSTQPANQAIQLTVYGIPNCDTLKKSLNWLKEQGINWEFHDYKKKGITEARLKKWVRQSGWEALLNRKGTTWRGLDDSVKADITSAAKAISLMKEHTSLIKRPVLEQNDQVLAIGFDPEKYNDLFGAD